MLIVRSRYVWGDSNLRASITVNGEQLAITRSLYEFIVLLRHKKLVDKPIWVDGICIDQRNILERNHQVKLMRDIYGRAEMVQIALGELDQTIAAPALRILDTLAERDALDADFQCGGREALVILFQAP